MRALKTVRYEWRVGKQTTGFRSGVRKPANLWYQEQVEQKGGVEEGCLKQRGRVKAEL
jgi:hypothetical protein